MTLFTPCACKLESLPKSRKHSAFICRQSFVEGGWYKQLSMTTFELKNAISPITWFQFQVWLFKKPSLSMCVYVCVCAQISVCHGTCVGARETSSSTLFVAGSLVGHAYMHWANWSASFWGVFHLCLPCHCWNLGTKDMYAVVPSFTRVLQIQTLVLTLVQQVIYSLNCLPGILVLENSH